MVRSKQTPQSSLRKRKRSSSNINNEPPKKKQIISDSFINNNLLSLSLQETLRNLKDNNISFNDRLSIAYYLWENSSKKWSSLSNDFIDIQLLQWLSYNFISSFKKNNNECFYLNPKAWKLFSNIENKYLLSLQSLDFIDNNTISQETKIISKILSIIASFILYIIKNNILHNNLYILDTCKLLLQYQWFKPLITIEQYTKFTITILETIKIYNTNNNNNNNNNNIDNIYYEFIQFIIEKYKIYLQLQSNHKKVFSIITSKILHIFINTWYYLYQHISCTNNIINEIKYCIHDTLFTLTDISHYSNDKQLVSYHHQLYLILENNCKSSLIILFSFPFLLESFIKESRKQNTITTNFHENDFFYHLFTILLSNIKSQILNTSKEYKNIIFNTTSELLNILIKYTVNLKNTKDIEDIFNECTLLLIKSIDNNINNYKQWESLTLLLKIHHQCILSILDSKIYPLIKKYPLLSYQIDFIIGLMQLYLKLHQSEIFFSNFFIFLNSNLSKQFYKELQNYTLFWIELSKIYELLSSQKEFEIIWKIFLTNFNTIILNNESNIHIYNIYSELFIIYLDYIKLSENNAEKIQKLIEESCFNIIKPLFKKIGLLSSKTCKISSKYSKLLISTLQIYSCLYNLKNHCDSLLFKSYHSNILQTGFLKPENYFSLLYYDNNDNNINILNIIKLISSYNNIIIKYPSILYTIILIAFQRIYDLHSCSISIIPDIINEIKELTSFIMDHSLTIWNNNSNNIYNQEWNGNIFNITSSNISVALFYIICKHLFFICFYINDKHMQLFLEFIMNPKLIQQTFIIKENNIKSNISIQFILKQLYNNDQFYELHPIRDKISFILISLFSKELSINNISSELLSKLLLSIKSNNSIDIISNIISNIINSNTSIYNNNNNKNKNKNSFNTEWFLYIITLLNSFPDYYLSYNHWKIIIPLIFIIEYILSNIIHTNKIITDNQFYLLCECKQIISKSLNNSLQLNTNQDILILVYSIFNYILINSYSIQIYMNNSMKNDYNIFIENIFNNISNLELQLSLNNSSICLSLIKRLQDVLNSKEFKLQENTKFLFEYYINYLMKILEQANLIIKNKEYECIQEIKHSKIYENTYKKQKNTLLLIDKDSKQQKYKKDKQITFIIPNEWKDLGKQINQDIISILLKYNSDSSIHPFIYLKQCFNSFSYILDFNKSWNSKYIQSNLKLLQCNPECIHMFYLAIQIIYKLYNLQNPIIHEYNSKYNNFISIIDNHWNNIKDNNTNNNDNNDIYKDLLIQSILSFIKGICGCFNYNNIKYIEQEYLYYILDLFTHILSQEFKNISFSNNIKYPQLFKDKNNIKYYRIQYIFDIYSIIIKTCSSKTLIKLINRIKNDLKTTNETIITIGLIYFYRLLSNTLNIKRGNIISNNCKDIINIIQNNLYIYKSNNYISRYILEIMHIIILKKYYQFTFNVVHNVLSIFSRFLQQLHNNTLDNDNNNDISFSAISKPLIIDKYLFLKQCRILSDCLLHRTIETSKLLPSFFYCVKLLLSTLGSICHNYIHLLNTSIINEIDIIQCIRSFSRLLKNIGSKSQITRFNIGSLLVDIIYILQHCSITSKQRNELQEGIFKLFDSCHNKDRQNVYILLDNTGKLIFKELFDKYDNEYKFTGKT